MILTCSACQTQYIVPENALGTKARTVKCAQCGYSWKQQPITVTDIDLSSPAFHAISSPDAAPDSDDAAVMAQQLRWQQALHVDAQPVAATGSMLRFCAKTVAWFAFLLLMTAISLAYARLTLVTTFPGTALLYEALQFPAPAAGAGLDFRDDTLAVLEADTVPTRLHVTGHFINTKPKALPLPILQARLFDKKGVWLKDWGIPLQNVGHIGGNSLMSFNYTLPQVPTEAYSLTFRFVDD